MHRSFQTCIVIDHFFAEILATKGILSNIPCGQYLLSDIGYILCVGSGTF